MRHDLGPMRREIDEVRREKLQVGADFNRLIRQRGAVEAKLENLAVIQDRFTDDVDAIGYELKQVQDASEREEKAFLAEARKLDIAYHTQGRGFFRE